MHLCISSMHLASMHPWCHAWTHGCIQASMLVCIRRIWKVSIILFIMLTLGFRCPHWVEITTGLSYVDYRCVDVYMRLGGNGIPPPTHEAFPLWASRRRCGVLIFFWNYFFIISCNLNSFCYIFFNLVLYMSILVGQASHWASRRRCGVLSFFVLELLFIIFT